MRRKKPTQRTTFAKESEPAAGSQEPRIRLPGPTQVKALKERLMRGQLLPEDYPMLRAVIDFRAQLPELLCQEGMTVERLGELMGVTDSEPMAEAPNNEPNPQTSRKGDSAIYIARQN